MSHPASWLQVDTCSIYPSDRGEGFVIEISQRGEASMCLQFPACVVQQLMRTLPHIDAAMELGREPGPSSLIAYPLLAWRVEGVAGDAREGEGGVVVQLRNDRFVDTSLDLDLDTAMALQRDLGLAIAQAQAPGAAEAASRHT